jgi:hypothetical protein
MLSFLLVYIPYAQGFINSIRESYVYVFFMIAQVSVYDTIVSKAYERNDQFSHKKLQSYLDVHTLSMISICIK